MNATNKNGICKHEGSIPFARYPSKSSTYKNSVAPSVEKRRSICQQGRPLSARFSSHAGDRLASIRKLKETISNLGGSEESATRERSTTLSRVSAPGPSKPLFPSKHLGGHGASGEPATGFLHCSSPHETPAQNLFHAHLDQCGQCRNNPFALCLRGSELLRESVTRALKATL